MKTIVKKKQIDHRAIHESLQKGFGIEHPERISGYAAFFIDYGDISVSDNIAAAMDRNEEFRSYIFSRIQDFQNDKYGYISRSDFDENTENKWIAGGGNIIGRYGIGPLAEQDGIMMPYDFIKIRLYKGNTYILYDYEPDWLILPEEAVK